MVLKVFLALEMEFVFFTKALDDEGLNPKAVEAVETATRRAAEVLNFIGAKERKVSHCLTNVKRSEYVCGRRFWEGVEAVKPTVSYRRLSHHRPLRTTKRLVLCVVWWSCIMYRTRYEYDGTVVRQSA